MDAIHGVHRAPAPLLVQLVQLVQLVRLVAEGRRTSGADRAAGRAQPISVSSQTGRDRIKCFFRLEKAQ